MRRSEPLAFGRAFSITMRSPRRSSQASSSALGGVSAVSVQPRRRSTAKESARDSRSPKRSRTAAEVAEVGSSTSNTVRSWTNCIPRVHVLPIPHPASAVSHGSREITMYVAPSSHSAEAFSAKYANHRPSGDRSHRCG